MNKNILMIIMSVLVLYACDSDHLSETLSEQTVQVIENPFIINTEKSIAEATEFLKNRFEASGNINLRSIQADEMSSTVSQTDYKIQIATHQKNSQRVEQKVPVYTIKYKNKNGKSTGTVITIGDERFERKMIAFNEEGEMDIAATKESADFLGDMIAGYIHHVVNKTTRKHEMQLKYTPIVYPSMYVYEIPIHTRWHHQGLPSTKYTPNNYSAGCNAVAIGQIMAYYQWPLKGRYKRYGTIEQATSYPAHIWPYLNTPMVATIYQDYISDLLAEIGYKMNSNYISTELTTAYPTRARDVFRQMGYECNSQIIYDPNIIANEIKRGRPVFMSGYKKDFSSGHSFVITKVGYAGDENEQMLGFVSMIYLNSGAGNSRYSTTYGSDGWYFADIFEYQSEYSDEELINQGMYNSFYPYRHNCGITIGIKPNLNNPGDDQNLYQVR